MQFDRISVDPAVCGGEACVKGTRVPVQVVLSHLAAGDDVGTVRCSFPRLTEADILACLGYEAYLASERAIQA